jgi:hypothetical protein
LKLAAVILTGAMAVFGLTWKLGGGKKFGVIFQEFCSKD